MSGGGGGGGGNQSMRNCSLIPVPLPPALGWLPLPPWLCPPAPAPAAVAAPPKMIIPHFAELNPPLAGWLEVMREPSSATLDLSQASGNKGDANDETMLNVSKRACGSMITLDVTGCAKITPAAVLSVCQANPRLQLVRAARGPHWGAGAITQVIAACPELKALEVDAACRRVDDTLLRLLVNPTLRLRELVALTKMTGATVTDMLAPQLRHSSLRRLVLTNCGIGVLGAKALAEVLSETATAPAPPLRHLNLYCCNIGAAGGRALGEMLRHNHTLRSLDLGFNNLCDEGAIAVARALQRGNATLKELSLARNNIRTDACRELGTMLEKNSCLESLSVADNDFGPVAGKLLAAALRRNRTLQQLACQGNRLGDTGRDFAAVMRDSKTLWKIDLHNNAMPEAVGRELAVLSLQALLRGDPRFDSDEDGAFEAVDIEFDVHEGDNGPTDTQSPHASDSSGSEDGESEDSDPGEEEEEDEEEASVRSSAAPSSRK